MYVCPQCGEQFELEVQGKADTVVNLVVVHDHELGRWRATAFAKGERRTEFTKDVVQKNHDMKAVARQNVVKQKQAEKKPLPWDVPPRPTFKKVEEVKGL